MTTTYKGIDIPDDGDLSNATLLGAAFEDVGDLIEALTANKMRLVGSGHPAAGGTVLGTSTGATYIDLPNATVGFSLLVGDVLDMVVGPLGVLGSGAVLAKLRVVVAPSGYSPSVYPMVLALPAGAYVQLTIPVLFTAAHAVSHTIKVQIADAGSDTVSAVGWGDDTAVAPLMWLAYKLWRPA
jgi:hypothetical protein